MEFNSSNKIKANTEAKIRLTLTGAEINMLEALIANNLEDYRRNGHGWMILQRKLQNKQIRRGSKFSSEIQ
tara:strand:- start:136 stop:348 length:213 start_codon:yes stop_codon:yes gene_type:complete